MVGVAFGFGIASGALGIAGVFIARVVGCLDRGVVEPFRELHEVEEAIGGVPPLRQQCKPAATVRGASGHLARRKRRGRGGEGQNTGFFFCGVQ